MFKVPEKYRVTHGPFKSNQTFGNNGLFAFKGLNIIASDGLGWEHVSVSKPSSTPTWEEMDAVKRLFWGADDLVIQVHPPEKDHINTHKHCLHLWRKSMRNDYCELPPKICV